MAAVASWCLALAPGCGTSKVRSSISGSLHGGEWPSTATTSSTIPPGQRVRGDGDADNPRDIDGNGDSDSPRVGGPDNDEDAPTRASYDFPDADDRASFAYGRPASHAVRRAVSRTVQSFYAAASRGDGEHACSFLTPGLAASAAADYGGPGGPPYLRGAKTCAAVLSLLFRHAHDELLEAIVVFAVRVEGEHARSIFSSRKMRASSIQLELQGGYWKLQGLIGQPLP